MKTLLNVTLILLAGSTANAESGFDDVVSVPEGGTLKVYAGVVPATISIKNIVAPSRIVVYVCLRLNPNGTCRRTSGLVVAPGQSVAVNGYAVTINAEQATHDVYVAWSILSTLSEAPKQPTEE